MECMIEEVGISQCMCPECQYNWQQFLAMPALPVRKAKACWELDAFCECDECEARRTSSTRTLEDGGLLKHISKSAGYSGRIVGFEFDDSFIWAFDYPLGQYGDTPVLVVPHTPEGLAKIEEYFAYCL